MGCGLQHVAHLAPFQKIFFIFFITSIWCLLVTLYHPSAYHAWKNTALSRSKLWPNPQLSLEAVPILEHQYSPNGLLQTNMTGKHPLLELMELAEKKHNALLDRQSKTLEQARTEYERRYERYPPRCFDRWYAFAVEQDFILIDEFDQINRDIAPLLALPRSVLFKRLEEAQKFNEKNGFVIDVRPSEQPPTLKGPAFSQTRTQLIYSLILSVSHGIPNLTLYGSGEDRSGRILGGEMRDWISENKGALPPTLLQKFENPFRDGREDIFSACLNPPHNLASNSSHIPSEQTTYPTFIHDVSLASDLCHHPSLVHLHGSLSAALDARGARLFPEFVFGKMPLGTEILLPDTAGFDSFTLKSSRSWSEKTYSKLFWRGVSTGAAHNRGRGGPLGWRGGSQRTRAAFTFANNSVASNSTSFLPSAVPLLTYSSTGKLEIKSYPRTALNKLYTDIGLVRPVVQCNETDGTCEEMEKEVPWRDSLGVWGTERSRWKYVLDLDSNGHSEDFLTSLGLGSVVLKSTIFPNWNSDWLIPYYHYIPIQQDYSDVYNVMAFFVGPPIGDSRGFLHDIDRMEGHDDLARKIGENAERFVRTMWRWEDMQVYMYRLLLEYARLTQDDEETPMAEC